MDFTPAALPTDPEAAAGLGERAGFDECFLGVPVPIPRLASSAAPGVRTILLPYTHFSVLLRPDKRLAAVTALGIDGAQFHEVSRSGTSWRLDPRLPADVQTGPEVYHRNDLDRGHLVRRASVLWGETREIAEQANQDSFFYTNAAPQAAAYNQSMDLWLGLETYLLDHAADHGRRLIVFTGPVFSGRDPAYRGITIPLMFFKVAAFLHEGRLAATGYVIDQSPQLEAVPGVPRPAPPGHTEYDDVPPLGPFRTFQVPIRDIAELTGLELSQLAAVDLLPAGTAASEAAGTGIPETWQELESFDSLLLRIRLAVGTVSP
ncbi:hypothetical protein GCM10027591_04980 [Zhihengliuella somnathii]